MELRMSLYPGEFLKFILRWSENIGPVHHLLKKRTPDPRMGDVELAVRYLAFADDAIQYRGDLKAFLDTLCSDYNTKFDDPIFVTSIQSELDSMEQAIETGLKTFGENRFCRKFIKGAYENRFNRALFDILVYSLANPQFRLWASQNGAEMVNGFEVLSTQDNDFLRAIETTTKSTDATATRFGKWLHAAQLMSGVQISEPNIAD